MAGIFGNIGNTIGAGFSALGSAAHNTQNYLARPNPYPQLKSPIPASQQVTHQLPQGVQSPIPQQNIVQHLAGGSPLQADISHLQNAFQGAKNNIAQWGNAFAHPAIQAQQPIGKINPTPTSMPGQSAWQQANQQLLKNYSPAQQAALYKQGATSPGGHFFGQPQQQAQQPQGKWDSANYAKQLYSGFTQYGNGVTPPAAQAIPAFVKAAETYPLFQQHPWILPAIAMKESSAGKANAPFMGYGVHVGAPTDMQSQVLNAAHAIATMPQYGKFRETGNPLDLLNTYAPPSENNTAQYAQQIPQFEGNFGQ